MLYIVIATILVFSILGGVFYALYNSKTPTPKPTPTPTPTPTNPCPNNCNGKGPCFNGRCECPKPFYGEDCSSTCEDTEGGTCNEQGKLICNSGWYPDGVCNKKCDSTNCKTPGGVCQPDGTCKCTGNFIPGANKDCSTCATGFGGSGCVLSKATCNNRGIPKSDGTCICDDNNSNGPKCEFTRADNCNNNGYPKPDGTCVCDTGVLGDKCEYDRKVFCNGNGDPSILDLTSIGAGKAYMCNCDQGYIFDNCKYKLNDCTESGGIYQDTGFGGACFCRDGTSKNSYPFCGTYDSDSCMSLCNSQYSDRNTNLLSSVEYARCIGKCPSA